MAFNQFGFEVAQYNATLPTFSDGDFTVLQTDVNGRLITRFLAQATDSIAVGDGTDTLAVNADGSINITDNGGSITVDGTVAVTQSTSPWVVSGTVTANQGTSPWVVSNAVLTNQDHIDGTAWAAGSHGFEALAVRHDANTALTGVDDGDWAPLQVDANGALKVSGSFNASVDDIFESGTVADLGTDPAGDGITPITTTTADLVNIAVGAGTTAYLVGAQFATDKQAQWEIVVEDAGVPVRFIRTGVQAAGMLAEMTFPRAIEIVGAATRTLRLRAKTTAGSGNAGGGLNLYTRP